jgi:UDP-GlcNAc3NAcA epimerase
MSHILTVVGARPQFIKAAPVSVALARAELAEVIVHTGQHFDAQMSDVFFEELDIRRPTHHLGIDSLRHGAMTGRMIERLEEVIDAERPACVLVYGDTNSTLAGALAAAKLHVPVAHVEAGLRSFNRRMPEEINRVVTDHVASLLFCPTAAAAKHLADEGIAKGVHVVGDVMYDMTLLATESARSRSQILATLGLEPGSYAVATVHRAENTDDVARFARVSVWLEAKARLCPVVLPAHPRTAKLMARLGIEPKGVRIVDPLGYFDMTWLVHNAREVLTDSGGLQKEAYFHRVPCVTLRDETEWIETVAAGWNRLWTTVDYVRPRRQIEDYGDGHAARAIARVLRNAI